MVLRLLTFGSQTSYVRGCSSVAEHMLSVHEALGSISGISTWEILFMGFSNSSVGKESACNAGDPSSIPGSERSAGEGIGCLPQYFGASLVAQLVKNLPAMWETWV